MVDLLSSQIKDVLFQQKASRKNSQSVKTWISSRSDLMTSALEMSCCLPELPSCDFLEASHSKYSLASLENFFSLILVRSRDPFSANLASSCWWRSESFSTFGFTALTSELIVVRNQDTSSNFVLSTSSQVKVSNEAIHFSVDKSYLKQKYVSHILTP